MLFVRVEENQPLQEIALKLLNLPTIKMMS